MLSRDLTASVIKTFFEELADVRDGGGQGLAFSGLYSFYFNREREWFAKARTEEITVFMADDPIHKLEMLVELMYQDALKLTSRELQAAMFKKIIELYEVVDFRSREFSVERQNRVEELKKMLED